MNFDGYYGYFCRFYLDCRHGGRSLQPPAPFPFKLAPTFANCNPTVVQSSHDSVMQVCLGDGSVRTFFAVRVCGSLVTMVACRTTIHPPGSDW